MHREDISRPKANKIFLSRKIESYVPLIEDKERII